MSTPWLPALFLLEDADGNWTVYLERIHQQFQADFIHSTPAWPGKRVGVKKHPEIDGKSATFWHLISEGSIESERTPDMRRCERIAWPRPVIEGFDIAGPANDEARILWWMELRGKEWRYHLVPADFSYVVVVADRGSYVLPWTAYLVEREHTRSKLQKRCAEYWRSQKS